MNATRRRLLQSLALTAGPAQSQSQPPQPPITTDQLRGASIANGGNLEEDRLRIVKPVIERRLAQSLRKLRNFEIDDAVEPHGRF